MNVLANPIPYWRAMKSKNIWKQYMKAFSTMSSKLQAPNKQEMSLSIPAYTHNPIFILKNCFGHSPYIRPSNVLGAGVVAKLHPTLCDAVNCSTPGSPVLHCLLELAQIHVEYLLEFAQTHVHWVGDAIQPSHSPWLSFCLQSFSQHQGLFQLVGFSHQVARVLELQRQHQSSLWIFRVDFFWDWIIWSPYSPRDSQESSIALQFESINSSAPAQFESWRLPVALISTHLKLSFHFSL